MMRGKELIKDNQIMDYLSQHSNVIILSMLFILGTIIGTMLIKNIDAVTLESLMSIINGFTNKRQGQDTMSTFFSTFSSSFTLLLILFFSGFCAIGLPIVVAVPFFRGLTFGFSAASIYAVYGVSAITYMSVLILPNILLSALIIILASKEALKLSGMLFSILMGTAKSTTYVRIYMARFAAFLIAVLLLGILDASLFFVFGKTIVL